jgi:uncharacterized protein YeaO (DUF488 family)
LNALATGFVFLMKLPTASHMIRIKRIYDKPEKEDGFRILVDRLWPRGLTKEKANVDLWLKEIAPDNALRKWFSHDPAKWNAFREKYNDELKAKPELISQLKQLLKKEKVVTLLYAAKDEQHNNAVALKELLS